LKSLIKNQSITKTAAILLIAGLFLSASFCAVLYFHFSRLVPIDISSCCDDGSGIKYGVFSSKCDNDSLSIWAYAVPDGGAVKQFECHILLNPVGTEKYYKAFTMVKDNCEIQSYVSGCANYKYTGFLCCVDSGRLKKGTDYRICILYKNDGKSVLLRTDEIVTGGEHNG